MPRAKRTRKQPIVSNSNAATTLSRKATQATISRFHTLLKRRAAIEHRLDGDSGRSTSRVDALQKELASLNAELESLGGLEAYQHASTLGQSSQRGGDSSKVLIKWLKQLRSDDKLPAAPLQYEKTPRVEFWL